MSIQIEQKKDLNWRYLLKKGDKLYPCKKLNDSCLTQNNRTLHITNENQNSKLVYYSTQVNIASIKEVNQFTKNTKPKAGILLKNIFDDQCYQIKDAPMILRLRVSFWLDDLITKFDSKDPLKTKNDSKDPQKTKNDSKDPLKTKNDSKDPQPKSKYKEKKTWVFEFQYDDPEKVQKIDNLIIRFSQPKQQPIIKQESTQQNSQQQSQSLLNQESQKLRFQQNQVQYQVLQENSPIDLEPPQIMESANLNRINWFQEYFNKLSQQANHKKDLESFLQSFYVSCSQECKQQQQTQIIVREYNKVHKNLYNCNKILFETYCSQQYSRIPKVILPPLCNIVYTCNKKFYCQLQADQAQEIKDEQLFIKLQDLVQENSKLDFLFQGSTVRSLDQNDFWILDIVYNQQQNHRVEGDLQKLISDLDYMRVKVFDSLSAVFHENGIRIKQLGQVAQNSKNNFIKQICIVEMIARTIKSSNRLNNIENYKNEILKLLRNFFQQQQFVDYEILKYQIQEKFDYLIDNAISIPKLLLLNSMMHHLNFQIDIRIQDLMRNQVDTETCDNFYQYLIENSLTTRDRGKYYFQKQDVDQREGSALNYFIVQEQEKKFMESRLTEDSDLVENSYKLLFGEKSIPFGQFQLLISQITDRGVKVRLHEAMEVFENCLPQDQEMIGLIFYQLSRIFSKEGALQNQLTYLKKAVNFFRNDHEKDFMSFEYCKIAMENQHFVDAYDALLKIENNLTEEMNIMGIELEQKVKVIGRFTEGIFKKHLERVQMNEFGALLSNSFKILKDGLSIQEKLYLDKLEYCLNKFPYDSQLDETLIHYIKYKKISTLKELFSIFIQKFRTYSNILEFNIGLYRNFKTILDSAKDDELQKFLQFYQAIIRIV